MKMKGAVNSLHGDTRDLQQIHSRSEVKRCWKTMNKDVVPPKTVDLNIRRLDLCLIERAFINKSE